MEKKLKTKLFSLKGKYIYSTILTLVIFILLGSLSYENLQNISKDYSMYLNNKKVVLKDGVLHSNSKYISVDDVTTIFKDNIYFDKISRKLIITTKDKLVKIKKEETDVIVKYGVFYYNLQRISNELGKKFIISNSQKNIYVSDYSQIEAKSNNNRVELFSIDSKELKVIKNFNKSSVIKIQIDENLKQSKNKFVNAIVTTNGSNYIGKVLKSNLTYVYKNDIKVDNQNTKKTLMVKATDKIGINTDISKINCISFEMLRLSSENNVVEQSYNTLKDMSKNVEIYASFNNGYSLSNYDADILTDMLNSDVNREIVCNKVLNYVKSNKLNGVVINFADFKSSDKDMFTQFIKEMAVVMHTNSKKVIVNISNTEYIDVLNISKTVDFVIIQAYGKRTISSNTSGSHSTVDFVEKVLTDIVKSGVSASKIILEIPAYSILWTERAGIVVDAEVYYMDAVKQYISKNNIEVNLDNSSGQNYFRYTKGIITYKMWLEDEYSLAKKIDIANKLNLAGVSIYKSGFESRKLYNMAFDKLNK